MKTRIILIISCFFSLSGSVHAVDYWQVVSSPTTKWLKNMSFPDTSNGWAVGDSGIVIHTSNGGMNWVIQSSPVISIIWSVSFLNTRLGWAVTSSSIVFTGSRILTTTNGGLLWTYYQFPDSTVELFTIHFLDSLNGWTAGSQGRVYQTTNGGATWTFRMRDSAQCSGLPILNLGFYDDYPVHAMGGAIDYAGVMWRSSNFGVFWGGRCVGPEPVHDIVVFDSLNAFSCGGDFDFGVSRVKTTDAGANWQYTELGFFGIGEAVAFRTRAEGWIATGFSGRFLLSLDSGNTWNEMYTPDTSAIYDFVFTDQYRGSAIGYNGAILIYRHPIGIQNENENIPTSYILFQNYPNPFNPSTHIKFSLPEAAKVRIEIYDVLGKLVRTIIDEPRSKGTHSVIFNGENLPSGIYYCRLAAPKFTDSKKIVLLK